MIAYCSCKHEFQDKIYGKGKRVYNHTIKTDSYRCTVCASLKSGKTPLSDDKKEKESNKKKHR